MEGNPDLIGLLAVDHHRLDALRYHGLGNVFAARAGKPSLSLHRGMPISSAISAAISMKGLRTSARSWDWSCPLVVMLRETERCGKRQGSPFACPELVVVGVFEFVVTTGLFVCCGCKGFRMGLSIVC